MSRTLRRIWNRLLGSLSRRNPDADLAEEFDSHIRRLAEENIRRGLPPEEAYRLFAGWIVQLLVSTTTLNIPRLDEVRVDFGVLVFLSVSPCLQGLCSASFRRGGSPAAKRCAPEATPSP